MAKQSIINETELTNFFKNGAVLQVSPNLFKLIWGPFQPQTLDIHFTSDQKTIIYKPDFWDFLETKSSIATSFTGTKELVIDSELLLQSLNQQKEVEFEVIWGSVQTYSFEQQFQWSQSQFQKGQLSKTVPIISQFGKVNFTSQHLATALKTVITGQNYGSTYGFWETKKDGLTGFLGHTPEVILDWHQEDQKIQTMALAGTMDHQIRNAEIILKDKKILEEHQFVIDDLVSALSIAVKNRNIEKQKTKVLELKYLYHLQTLIEIANVPIGEVKTFIDAIHPTAALGLYPRKKEAYLEFKKFEVQNQRKNFAAPFAFFSRDQVKAIAAIRLFNFTSGAIEIISGCGVTKDSVLQDELHESTSKRNSVKKMMGMNL